MDIESRLRTIEPVSVTRLADEVAGKIRSFIRDQELAVGTRLPSERTLAGLLGASRPTVSQALRTLSLMGLVEVRRGSGAYVLRQPASTFSATMNFDVQLDSTNISYLVDVRVWLETIGAVEAVKNASEAEIERQKALFVTLQKSSIETSSWIAADTIFHASLVALSGNQFLAALYESVHTTIIEMEYRPWVEGDQVPSWLDPKLADRELELHEPILNALVDRDMIAIVAAVRAHDDAMRLHLGIKKNSSPSLRSALDAVNPPSA